jgi:CRISPR-associated protein Csx17
LIEDLLFGFALIRWDDREALGQVADELFVRWSKPVANQVVPRSWALLKHLYWPGPLVKSNGTEIKVRPEPAITPLLCANRVGDACAIAARRLFIAGFPTTRARLPNHQDGVRIAGALLFPLRSLNSISKLVIHMTEEKR